MELTPEQRAIVDAGDVDVAVSAGAGSGKTHVLVERYLRLLELCTIPEIAAVTFTDAAAAEMRRRVRREVMTRTSLAQHREHVDEAMIGTIHSLCLRLLRQFPVEAAIDPSAAVLAEDEAELLRRAACKQAIDAAAESGDARTSALRALGVYTTDQMLPQMVAARADLALAFAALPADAAAIAADIKSRLETACRVALDPLRLSIPEQLAALRRSVRDRSDLLAGCLEDAVAALGDPQPDGISEWADRLGAASKCINLNAGKGAAWSIPVSEAREHLRAVRTEISEALKAIPLWNETDEICAAATPGLRALFDDACCRYASAKRERQSLDFLDLEISAVALLGGHAHVAATCRRHYRHIMLDEAQDVSPIQAQLIRLLIGEGPRRPRLFLVGDEKQSIYGFRGADVRQFRRLRDLVRCWEGLLLPLSASFRTHLDLVEQTNDLFGHAFQGSAMTMEPMTGRPGDPPAGPHLVLTPILAAGRDYERRLMEADLVAREICGLVDGGRKIRDGRAGYYRPVRHGDIAILLRRFTNVHVFEQALEAHGVPFATPSGTGFFTRQEVLDLANLLRWLVEPDDEIALMGVLRSPLFILGDDTLLALRALRRPFLRALADPPSAIIGAERERCLFAGEVLRDLRRTSRTASATDLLEQVLDQTALEATWAALSGGDQALANIRKLVRLCSGLSGYTLAEVVDYLEQRRDDLVARESPAVLDRPNAVQVMTVHGAKGLEFPVVFVPEAHVAAHPASDAVRWRAEEGVSFTLEQAEEDTRRPRPGFYTHLANLNRRDEEEEHLRLFYVAATRAGDYLYISGDDTGNGGWIHAANSARDAGVLRDIESRLAVAPDLDQVARRPAPRTVVMPPAPSEIDYTPELLRRPPVIPLRTSTPVTALRLGEFHHWGHADGLGLVRGRITHRAIEAQALASTPLDNAMLSAIVAAEASGLDASTRSALTADAREMLARFAASEAGRATLVSGSRAQFELPFAWDWNGIPVHGQVDLLYYDEPAGLWCVVDFKTDRVAAGREAEAAAPYLVQIGLYAQALEAAVGEPPRAGLLFLRSGVYYEPPRHELDSALAEARRQVDAGLMLDPALVEYLGDAE
jgi:ATP-dependent helicase/nuclease subunit A